MNSLQHNELTGAVAAIRFHLQVRGMYLFTAEEIHEQWTPWPTKAQPIDLTRRALELLEESGQVKRVRANGAEFWCVAANE